MINGGSGRDRLEKGQYFSSVLQVPAGQFPNDEGMANDIARFQQGRQISITISQMANPH